MNATAVLPAHACTTRTCDDHSANRDARPGDAVAHPEPPQDVQRARVDRVATQLVAGERGSIEQANAAPGAGEQERRNRAGRTSACDYDLVTHPRPRPNHASSRVSEYQRAVLGTEPQTVAERRFG